MKVTFTAFSRNINSPGKICVEEKEVVPWRCPHGWSQETWKCILPGGVQMMLRHKKTVV